MGFEELLTRPPPGFVEPDPGTFEAIARLFDSAVRLTDSRMAGSSALRQMGAGLRGRLSEAATSTRQFRRMAEKELRGEPLSSTENEAILYVGRVAEHGLLVFKSMANESLALSNPDPMPKVADVAGSPEGLLMAAVGRPMQWDLVVPHFGRRQVVKGSIYSYFEFVAPSSIDDAEWRDRVKSARHPSWIEPYVR
jgi:hypothetical protein